MKVLIAGVIWNKDGRIGARESLCARMAERELARMAEARDAGDPAEKKSTVKPRGGAASPGRGTPAIASPGRDARASRNTSGSAAREAILHVLGQAKGPMKVKAMAEAAEKDKALDVSGFANLRGAISFQFKRMEQAGEVVELGVDGIANLYELPKGVGCHG